MAGRSGFWGPVSSLESAATKHQLSPRFSFSSPFADWYQNVNNKETTHHHGRIGPNAVIRMAEALQGQVGHAVMEKIFRDAGLDKYLGALPEQMVDEREVTELHRALRGELSGEAARMASVQAGLLTGDYLLANRIPRAVQVVLKLFPPKLASHVLLKAIGRNSWTFAGSGEFSAKAAYPVTVAVAGCPICRDAVADAPLCDYYAATFQRLYSVLVARTARVVETSCQAQGAEACVFEITW
jgi:divinyl protochlorophyllide a 8-vinyl-reductase